VRPAITFITEFASIAMHVINIARPIVRTIALLVRDEDGMTVEEAEKVALEVVDRLGDVRVNIKGQDVLDDQAQEHLAIGIGRLAWHVVNAVRDE
jgi:hypothetical protein